MGDLVAMKRAARRAGLEPTPPPPRRVPCPLGCWWAGAPTALAEHLEAEHRRRYIAG